MEAIGLLQLAAEIEHALMIQYLYAAASLPAGSGDDRLTRNKIMSVAVQEMGHLISVQNLLLLVGGRDAVHFGRDGIRATSPDNPLPLVLEPVSREALAKFIVAEMPAEVSDPTLRERVEALVAIAGNATGTTPHRVGALYAKLFWLFQPDDTPIAPLHLSPNAALGLKAGWHLAPTDLTDQAAMAEFQATRDEWLRGSVTGFILAPAASAPAARELITAISEQGEGLGETRDSHFYEYLELLEALESGGVTPVVLPVNPVARLAPAPDAGQSAPIITPYAKLWAELFDIRYNLLLLDFWHAMTTPIASPKRRPLITLAYADMNFLWDITEHLLEIRELLNASDAACPFGLLYEDLPETEALRWQRHAMLLEMQGEIVRAIRDSPEFQDCSSGECEILDFDGNIHLGNIEQSDVARRALITDTST